MAFSREREFDKRRVIRLRFDARESACPPVREMVFRLNLLDAQRELAVDTVVGDKHKTLPNTMFRQLGLADTKGEFDNLRPHPILCRRDDDLSFDPIANHQTSSFDEKTMCYPMVAHCLLHAQPSSCTWVLSEAIRGRTIRPPRIWLTISAVSGCRRPHRRHRRHPHRRHRPPGLGTR